MDNIIFDTRKKTFEERSKHIEMSISENKLNKEISNLINKNETLDGTKTGNYLERITNYLLESEDILSGRKVEYDYYRSEKDYKSNFATGRNSIPISNEIIEKINEYPQYTNKHIDINFIKRLFNPEKLSEDDIRRFIVKGCNYTRTDSEELRNALSWLWDVIMTECTDREKEIVNMFDGKRTVKEVAEMQGITSQGISYFIKNISKKALKSLTFPE